MGKGITPPGVLILGLLLTLAVPGFAATAFDAAATPMLGHVVAAAAVMSILQWRRIGSWLHDHAGLRAARSFGFVFAICYALFSTALTVVLVQGQPVPRFNDVFLVGIVLTCYLFTWEPAACLLGISVLVSAWALPPNGSMVVRGFAEWYRLISFTLVAIFMIMVITRMKSRRSVVSMPVRGMAIHAAASGD